MSQAHSESKNPGAKKKNLPCRKMFWTTFLVRIELWATVSVPITLHIPDRWHDFLTFKKGGTKYFLRRKTLCNTFYCFNPPKSAKKSQQIGEKIGGPIFRQNRLPLPWISVPGPKDTFLMVAQQLESCGNPKYLSIFENFFFVSQSLHGP